MQNTKTITKAIMTWLSILLLFLTGSCNNKKDGYPLNVIPVESTVGTYNILNLSDFATEIKYVPLETNDSVLISPRILQVFYENEKILILDITSSIKNNCYLFDNEGKFCRKIGQWGQGPDDYIQIDNVFMLDNFIFLMARRKLLIYDTAGNLIENINMRSDELPVEYRQLSLCRIIPLKKNTFVVNVVTHHMPYPTAFLFETNEGAVKPIKEYPSSIKLNKLSGVFSSTELGSMYRFKDDVRIYKPINDTIFTIGQNMEIKGAFVIELGKYRPALSFFDGNDPWENFIFLTRIFESLNHLYLVFDFGNHAPDPFEAIDPVSGSYTSNKVFGVFDKFSGELTLMRQPQKGKIGFNNDIDNGPVIFPHYISSNNELVTFITVEEFLDYYDKTENPTPQMTKIAKNLNFDDNQIVIIAKLK